MELGFSVSQSVSFSRHLLFDKTFPREMQQTHLLTQTGSLWQTKVQMPPRSNSQWTKEFFSETTRVSVPYKFLTRSEIYKHSSITKTHPSTGDSSQKLGSWSTLCRLQEARQVGESPLEVTLVLNLLAGSWIFLNLLRLFTVLLKEHPYRTEHFSLGGNCEHNSTG